MAGQHLNDLLRRTTGMSSKDVAASKMAWEATATALGTIQTALNEGKQALVKGFGERETGTEAVAVFDGAVARISGRQQEMADVATALEHASTAMKAAETAAGEAPDAPPAQPPTAPPATGDIADDVTALKQHANAVTAYNQSVTAYGNADEEARKKVEALLRKYDEAYTALSKIEGQPIERPGDDGSGSTGPGGGHVPPRGHGSVPTGTWINDDTGTHVPDLDGGDSSPVPHPLHPLPDGASGAGSAAKPPPVFTLDPDLELPPAPDGGNGFDLGQTAPAVIGGATAAGVFGAPGIVRGIRGLVSGRALGSGGAGSIGASSRAGAPGSLGRTGGGVAGTPVSRAGGRGAAGGAAGATGRGRGGPGGRGGAAGGAGGRGRQRDEREQRDRDLYDDGQDWLDDEGSAPGVLD